MAEAIKDSQYDMQSLSMALGKNRTYVQQYVKKLAPKYLPLDIALDISRRIPAIDWRDHVRPEARSFKPATPVPQACNDDDVVLIDELDVRAAAGDGAFVEENHVLRQWKIPRTILIHGNAEPENVRIIVAEGDSMEPLIRGGDYLIVDTSRRNPTPPGIFVLWDGIGVLCKRLEYRPATGSVVIASDNPLYEKREATAEDIMIQGRVFWIFKMV